MKKEQKKIARIIPKRQSRLETDIIVEENTPLSDHPYCFIPPYYFDKSSSEPSANIKTLFSVETWDGRNVITFSGRQGNK